MPEDPWSRRSAFGASFSLAGVIAIDLGRPSCIMAFMQPRVCSLASCFTNRMGGLILLPLFLALAHGGPAMAGAERPNILWLVAEDFSPNLGCYGDTNAVSPNLDKLAAKGLRYTQCWSSAPVCAPARTTLISGVFPTSMGAENMRSEVRIPEYLRTYPQLLREAGYYCVNKSKEDYNIKTSDIWHESSAKAHYRNRAQGQPFFAAFNMEITHESRIRSKPHDLQHDPASMRVPAYHPDTPEVRRDWAQYYDNITTMDGIVGNHLRELEKQGLADSTIVFFYGDHGSGMPRSKRWPYNSGLHVPLIIHIPPKFQHLAPADYRPGGASARLVAFIDFAPTLLSLAGREAPNWMQGFAFMGAHASPPQQYVHGFRGRMDERYDMVRSVRNDRYVYIRNYMPHLIYGQYLEYMFQTPTTRIWKQLYDEGKLQPPKTFFWETKPAEELYDLESDPDEVHNLADASEHKTTLEELRKAHREHTLRIRDAGFLAEAEQHARAGEGTIYEMAQDPQRYALERIMSAAELATKPTQGDLPAVQKLLADQDSGARYWAATGLLVRGAPAIAKSRDQLLTMLKDPSASVRIVAARALGLHGTENDLPAVLAVLEELMQPAKSGAYAAMMALNAIDAMGAKAAPLRPKIKSMPSRDPSAPGRANGYVPRLVTALTSE